MWYEATVRHLETTEDGKQRRVTSRWLVEAQSVVEAESRATDELGHLEEFEVAAVKETKIMTVYSDEECDKYYLARVATIDVDEKGREKRLVDAIVVSKGDFHSAYARVREAVSSSLADEIVSIGELNIKGVFCYG